MEGSSGPPETAFRAWKALFGRPKRPSTCGRPFWVIRIRLPPAEGAFRASRNRLPRVEGTFRSSETTFHRWKVILGDTKPPYTGGRCLPVFQQPLSARGRDFSAVRNDLPQAEGTFEWLNLTISPLGGQKSRIDDVEDSLKR